MWHLQTQQCESCTFINAPTDAACVMCYTLRTQAKDLAVQWEWRADEKWIPYDLPSCMELELAFKQGLKSIELSKGYFSGKPGYVVHFGYPDDGKDHSSSGDTNSSAPSAKPPSRRPVSLRGRGRRSTAKQNAATTTPSPSSSNTSANANTDTGQNQDNSGSENKAAIQSSTSVPTSSVKKSGSVNVDMHGVATGQRMHQLNTGTGNQRPVRRIGTDDHELFSDVDLFSIVHIILSASKQYLSNPFSFPNCDTSICA